MCPARAASQRCVHGARANLSKLNGPSNSSRKKGMDVIFISNLDPIIRLSKFCPNSLASSRFKVVWGKKA